jgi:hypothetical protein
MGSYFTTATSANTTNAHAADVLADTDLTINIRIHAYQPPSPETNKQILEYLQHTHPVVSYAHGYFITLLYKPDIRTPFIRSNVVRDLISYMSSELAVYLVKETEVDPRMIDIRVEQEAYTLAMTALLNTIKENQYKGVVYGLPEITADVLKEQFG